MEEEAKPEEEEVEPPLVSTDATGDLLVRSNFFRISFEVDILSSHSRCFHILLQGLNEINPKAAELEESNALALAIVPPGSEHSDWFKSYQETLSSCLCGRV
jgi:hypothetical protein